MRRFALTGILFGAFVSTAAAQQAQLTWEGEVYGPTRLVIHGDRVDVTGNAQVDRANYRFFDQFPNRATNLTAQVVQGRGTVRVVEQPYRDNNFRAVVAVNPRGQREYMVVNVFWDAARAGRGGGVLGNQRAARRGAAAGAGSLTWSGQVDQEAVIEFRGRQVVERTLRGRPVYRHNVDMTSALPRFDTNVNLVDARGRGRVEVVQHPSAQNGYVAAVRVLDAENGAGDYSFTLNWGDQYGYQTGAYGNDPYRNDPYSGSTDSVFGSRARAGSGRVLFAGRVDGRIRVTMQGGRYWIDVLSGAPPRDVRVDFGSPLPAVAFDAEIERQRGRDEVRLIQRPDSSNGYRLVFEIDDDSSGNDYYEVEVKW
jgi:hypothetical protein